MSPSRKYLSQNHINEDLCLRITGFLEDAYNLRQALETLNPRPLALSPEQGSLGFRIQDGGFLPAN